MIRGSTFLLAHAKTDNPISVDLREKVEFLSLPLSFPPLSCSPSVLSAKNGPFFPLFDFSSSLFFSIFFNFFLYLFVLFVDLILR